MCRIAVEQAFHEIATSRDVEFPSKAGRGGSCQLSLAKTSQSDDALLRLTSVRPGQ